MQEEEEERLLALPHSQSPSLPGDMTDDVTLMSDSCDTPPGYAPRLRALTRKPLPENHSEMQQYTPKDFNVPKNCDVL